MPGALQERPVLTKNQWFYREVFDELSGSRAYSMEGMPMPIPISEIAAYCDLFCIDGLELRQRIFLMVRAQDAGFRKVMRDKMEQDAKRGR